MNNSFSPDFSIARDGKLKQMGSSSAQVTSQQLQAQLDPGAQRALMELLSIPFSLVQTPPLNVGRQALETPNSHQPSLGGPAESIRGKVPSGQKLMQVRILMLWLSLHPSPLPQDEGS